MPYSGSFRALAAGILMLLALAAPALAARATAKSPLDGYDAFVETSIQDFKVPGLAVAIVKDGEVVYAKGFGYRDAEKKLPVTADTLFAIGSCTKAFTTFTLATLVEEGRLDWDKPVRTFLPGFQMYSPETTALITPRDLVTHRSGLPRHDFLWYNNNTSSRKEIVERLRYLEPSEQLRAKWQYNNLMYLTAGYLIESVTGKSWEDNVRERIFSPLGMTRANFSVADSQKDPDHALPYREYLEGKVVLLPFRDITMIGPAGSINSSANEMAQWVKLHLSEGKVGDRRLLGATALADLHAPQMVIGLPSSRQELTPASYSLGWAVYGYRGHTQLSHGGGIDGFTSFVTLLPQDGLGMVILTNKEGTGLTETLARHTVDRFLRLDPIDWNGEALARLEKGLAGDKEASAAKESVRKPGTKPDHDLAEYAGDYEDPGYGPLKVAVAGDHLEVTYNGITAPLEHWHYEVWNGKEDAEDPSFENLKFQFQSDLNGNVSAVSALFEPRVKSIVFTKKPDARLSDPTHLARYTGEYEVSGQTATISLSGNVLALRFSGGPPRHLEPTVGGGFVLREARTTSIVFTEDAQGNVTGARLNQPAGVYSLTKKK